MADLYARTAGDGTLVHHDLLRITFGHGRMGEFEEIDTGGEAGGDGKLWPGAVVRLLQFAGCHEGAGAAVQLEVIFPLLVEPGGDRDGGAAGDGIRVRR